MTKSILKAMLAVAPLLFLSFALASAGEASASPVAKLAPEVREAFGRGMTAFEAQDFEAAYAAFFEAFAAKPDSVPVNFMLGRAASAKGDHEAAIMAYERVLAVEPALDRAKLELARSYYELGTLDMARKHFDEVLAKDPPETVRKNIQSFLVRMEAAEKRHYFSGVVSVGLSYDDNVRVSPGDPSIDTVLGDVVLSGPSAEPQEDMYFTELLALNYKYKNPRSPWALKASLVEYGAFYDDETDLDLVFLNASVGPSLELPNFVWDVRLHGTSLTRDYEEYLQAWGASTSMLIIPNQKLVLGAQARVEEKVYPDTPLKDASNLQFNFGPTFLFEKGRLTARALVETEAAADPIESYERSGFDLQAVRQLPNRFEILAGYKRSWTEYDQQAALFNELRRDRIREYSIGVARRMRDDLRVELRHTYTEANSTVDLYQYDRNLTSLTISWSF